MYRGKPWTMRQYAGFGTAEESNKRYHYLLNQGQTGLSIAFDLPTQMGRDSDHAYSNGEVGRVGVAIDSIEDMRVLLKGLPLDTISTSMTINATAPILLALYIAVGDEQGIDRTFLRGTIQNDILKEYISRGTYIYPPKQSMRLITDVFTFCKDHVPSWNTISISGYHIREAGADAVQELAFTLANAMTYVEAAIEQGMDVDDFAPRLAFFFNVQSNFLEEIAKFRAARRMWATIIKKRFNACNPKSMLLRFHTQTAGVSLLAQQPHTNISRVALQAMSAVLGGTQSLHTNSHDEALGLPTKNAAQIALRTQQIIAHETGVVDFVDPLAGSYVVESLTDSIEQEAQQYLNTIEDKGGVIACIESGFIQKNIERRAYEHQQSIEDKTRIVVGFNEFTTDDELPIEIQTINSELEKQQKERLALMKTKRNQTKTNAALRDVISVAQSSNNLLPPLLAAVKAHATIGELSDALRDVWGEYTPSHQ